MERCWESGARTIPLIGSFDPRPAQKSVLNYSHGRLGVSAVPGSGKTHTLSALAAMLIASRRLAPDQEILVVTLVNSAVDNFTSRIAAFARELDLVPRLGYRVRTLHGLAHDIVRENPPLAGLDKKFTILDETSTSLLIRQYAREWAHAHPELRIAFLRQDLSERQLQQVERQHWPDLIEVLAAAFIRTCKDRRLTPAVVRQSLRSARHHLPLAEMGADVYEEYQDSLTYRGAVDFDDLIRLAAELLAADPDLLERLRRRWPIILEDEAQDSSQPQEQILGALAGPDGNWVRVGDPNQGIFETFTTAKPELLREFIRDHRGIAMAESGRSQESIMALANQLVHWTTNEHPVPRVRDALTGPPMQPAPPGDPQPNPHNNPEMVILDTRQRTPLEEISAVALSLKKWLESHPDSTVAALSSTNDHAANLVKALQQRGIRACELLRSTSPTRATAGALSHILAWLSEPTSSKKLAQVYRVWRRDWREDGARSLLLSRIAALLERIQRVEAFLIDGDTLAASTDSGASPGSGSARSPGIVAAEPPEAEPEMAAFREIANRWQAAVGLPIDQLVLTLAQDLFSEAQDLALAHKLALLLSQLADENPNWTLHELAPRLNEIARNERKFLGFSADDTGFDPDAHKGEVVVATIHKAKGLEWDRVYLMSVNSYDFPSAQPDDRFIAERWFVRDGLNLEAEALAQLGAATTPGDAAYEEGRATLQARLDYVRERLRLLYVGITRARRELVMTWNTGRRGEALPALALSALKDWWLERGPSQAS